MLTNNNDDEYEEVLLSLTFPEILTNDDNKNMLLSKAMITISDLNTSTPSCNINGYEFKGKYQYSLGI